VFWLKMLPPGMRREKNPAGLSLDHVDYIASELPAARYKSFTNFPFPEYIERSTVGSS